MPKRAEALIYPTSLVSQSNPFIFQASPTLAAGDVKISIDGGALTNLTNLPTVTPAGGKRVEISLTAAEMTGDNITIIFSDAMGAEWQDQTIILTTSTQDIDDVLPAADYTAPDNATIAANASAISALGTPLQAGAAVALTTAYDAAKTAASQSSVDDLTDDVYALTHNEDGDTVPRVIPPPSAPNYCTVYEILTNTTTRQAPPSVTATAKLIALPYNYNGQLFTDEVIPGTYAAGVVSWQLPYGARALIEIEEGNVLKQITVPPTATARVYTITS